MKMQKEDVIKLCIKILNDTETPYSEEKPIEVFYSDKKGAFINDSFSRGWICDIPAFNWQFQNDDGGYSISINDQTGEPSTFIDATGGRVPTKKIIMGPEGKYLFE